MVESRLRKRVRALNMPSLNTYGEFLLGQDGLQTELIHVIDCVTTNKTDFFREPEHFVILRERAVARLLAGRQYRSERHIKVWSAACSIGAEPYTLAMVLDDMAGAQNFTFSIVGTDISTAVIRQAVDAVYPSSMMVPVPPLLRKRYVMRAADPAQDTVRMVPELRSLVRFGRLNLMDKQYPVDTDFDIIFVRNILIYFSRSTQEEILGRLCNHLRPGGYLFLGHAESITQVERFSLLPFAPTVFSRR